MQNSDAPSAAVSSAAASTSSVSRKGVAFTGVSKADDCEQKWQSSGHPPVLADRIPSTSTCGPHHASRTSWASAARAGTEASGTRASDGQLVLVEQPPLVEQGHLGGPDRPPGLVRGQRLDRLARGAGRDGR